MSQYLGYVVITGDNPCLVLTIPVDWVFRSQFPEIRVRVRRHLIREYIVMHVLIQRLSSGGRLAKGEFSITVRHVSSSSRVPPGVWCLGGPPERDIPPRVR